MAGLKEALIFDFFAEVSLDTLITPREGWILGNAHFVCQSFNGVHDSPILRKWLLPSHKFRFFIIIDSFSLFFQILIIKLLLEGSVLQMEELLELEQV